MRTDSPLQGLNGHRIGSHLLCLTQLTSTSRSGWSRFEFTISNNTHCSSPVVAGIYSVGGRGVTPWLEILRYQPRLRCDKTTIDLEAEDLELPLFKALATVIPPGGHIMVWCENAAQQDTYAALIKGVPPSATHLGNLLLRAGFPKVKFFDLAEGGLEGQQKLWAEKPLDNAMALVWKAQTVRQLREFIASSTAQSSAPYDATRALSTLEEFERDHST